MFKKTAALLILTTLFQGSIHCCTNFTVTVDGATWAAGNEDYPDNDSQIWIKPPEEGKYGAVIFGLSHYPPADGINDQGLYFGTNTAPFKEIPFIEGKEKGDLFKFTYEVLENCDKVECVVDVFKKYDFSDTGFEQGQLIFADKYGGGVVMEGHTEFYKTGDYLITANFYNSEPDLEFSDPALKGGEGHNRYKTVEYWLSKMETLNISDIKKTMQAVSGPVTQYSNIYNLDKNMIYVYYQRDYENVAVIDISEIFKNGEQLFHVRDLTFVNSFEIENEQSDETDDFDDKDNGDVSFFTDTDSYMPEIKDQKNSSGCSIGGFYEA